MPPPLPKWVLPAGLIAAALAIRLVLFTGLQGNDDLIYSGAAWGLLHGESPIRVDLLATRVGFTVPLAGLYAVLGVHPWVLALPALLASLSLVFLAWRIGRDLYSPAGGAMAAAVAALTPLDVLYSTAGFLDCPLAALLGAGAYCSWTASRREAGWGHALAAGAFWGWAYLVKESAIPLILPLLPFVVRPSRWRAVLVSLGGVAAVVLAEAVVYGIAFGDVLHRFHLAHQAQSGASEDGFLARLLLIPSFCLNPAGPWAAYAGTLPVLAAAGWILACRRGRSEASRLGLWWLGSGMLLALFPLGVWPYQPALTVQPRMLAVMTLPGSLLAAALWEAGPRARRWVAGAGVVAGALALLSSVKLHADSAIWSRGAEWAFLELSGKPGTNVITDPRTAGVLRLRAGYRPPWNLVAYDPTLPAPSAGTLLLRNGALASHAERWDGVPPPPWWNAADPPRTTVAEARWRAPWRIRGPRGPDEAVSILATLPGTRP